MKLKAPFPWFGGKSRVAHLVWERFGDVPNYVEPFAGSLAVPLARPHEAQTETVNDKDACIANFWRAIQAEPAAVARWADWPVNEIDLHARHQWLHGRLLDAKGLSDADLKKRVQDDGLSPFAAKLEKDPNLFDAQLAGWWVWGLSCWIGGNWCRPKIQNSLPHLGGGKGSIAISHTHTHTHTQETPEARAQPRRPQGGQHKKLPHLTSRQGTQSLTSTERGTFGTGNWGGGKTTPAPHEQPGRASAWGGGQASKCPSSALVGESLENAARSLGGFFEALSERLKRVRVCCGDWSRICKPSVCESNGVTGVFLDPPYEAEGMDDVYGELSRGVAPKVREWCKANGSKAALRVALCGYEGEHNELEALGWTKDRWKAVGGYGARNPDNENAGRERIWFSPHCLKAGLFD